MEQLTFALDAELDDNGNYIQKNTIVDVYRYKWDSTIIIFLGEKIDFLNNSFIELREDFYTKHPTWIK